MAGVEADEEINPVAMEVGKVEEEMDEELDTDMVVLGELGGKIFFIWSRKGRKANTKSVYNNNLERFQTLPL